MSDTQDENEVPAKGKVLPLPRKAAGPRQASRLQSVPFFPPTLKRHYLDVLAQYKEKLSADSGRATGWQRIRDMIMEREDAQLCAASELERIKLDNTRPRSPALTLEDLKGWFGPKASHLPSDQKFQYIDRFIRGLRLAGDLDDIEQSVAAAERDYVREALVTFYRPGSAYVFPGTDTERKAYSAIESFAMNALDLAQFVAECHVPVEASADADLPADGSRNHFLLFLICHNIKNGIAPIDVVASFPKLGSAYGATEQLPHKSGHRELKPPRLFDVAELQTCVSLPLYSGFIVPEQAGRLEDTTEYLGCKLVLTKYSLAFHTDEGLAAWGRRTYHPRFELLFNPSCLILRSQQDDEITRVGAALNFAFAYAPKYPRIAFTSVSDNDGVNYLRRKFAIGYRPC